jgi:hypothetical protein
VVDDGTGLYVLTLIRAMAKDFAVALAFAQSLLDSSPACLSSQGRGLVHQSWRHIHYKSHFALPLRTDNSYVNGVKNEKDTTTHISNNKGMSVRAVIPMTCVCFSANTVNVFLLGESGAITH